MSRFTGLLKSDGSVWLKRFHYSAGVILIITGVAKIWSTLGTSGYLQIPDPITNVQFGHLMMAVGIVEVLIALVCFFMSGGTPATVALAWLSTCFAVYRAGLWWIGWHRPCNCLGYLTDALGISHVWADNLMKGVLAFLLVGSYSALAFSEMAKRRLGLRDTGTESSVAT